MSEYQAKLSAISLNKAVCYGLLPFTLIAIGAVHFKYPTKYKIYKERAAIGAAALAVITNLRAFDASSKIPQIESNLIDKYVITLPEA